MKLQLLQKSLQDNADKCHQAHMELVMAKDVSPAQFEAYDRQYLASCAEVEEAAAILAENVERLMPPRAEQGAVPPVVTVELKASDLQSTQPTWGKFDGNLFFWQSFKDRFTAAVHANENIKPVFKLQHLLASLSGRAARVVGTRQPTEQGYQAAWQRLCEIYDDPYMIIRAILEKMHRMSVIERASYDNLRKLVDTNHESVRQLRELNVPVEHWDQILVYMMVKRLDSSTADAWEMSRGNGLPTLEALCAFLDKRAQSLAHSQPLELADASSDERPSRGGQKRKHQPNKPLVAGDKPANVESGAGPAKSAARPGAKTLPPCPQCEGSHPIYHCPALKELNLAGRKEVIRGLGLCQNCLKKHAADKCGFGPCGDCKPERHNSLLCPRKYGTVNACAANETPEPQAKRRRKKQQATVKPE